MHSRFIAIGVVALLYIGCSGGDNGPSPDPDAGLGQDVETPLDHGNAPDLGPNEDVDDEDTKEPEPVPTAVAEPPGERPETQVEMLLEGTFLFAAPLSEDDVLLQSADSLLRLDDGDANPVQAVGDPGTLISLLDLGEGAPLVLATGGLYALVDDMLSPSPVAELFESGPSALALGVDGDVWMSSATGLHLHREGQLFPVQIEDVDLAHAEVVFGPSWSGTPALWAVAAQGLTAITESQGVVEAWVVRDDLNVNRLAADSAGNLWVMADGDVHVRYAEETWEWFQFPTPVVAVAARAGQDGIWFATQNAVWRYVDGAFWKLLELSGATLISAAAGETLLILANDGVRLLNMGPAPEPIIPTWIEHIQPLSNTHCSFCHGPGKFAQPMHTYEHWVERIDKIIVAVENGAMPLAAEEDELLSKQQINMIDDWKEGGFLE